jgi:hypothetical protein
VYITLTKHPEEGLGLDAEDIKTYLTALSEQLELQGKHDVELVVCGGAALSILGLSQRTTRDIDAMAFMVASHAARQSLVKAEFDDKFERAAAAVARDYGLPEDWINCGPADQLDTGLPDGFQDRLISVRYGENLVVHYCSRTDLIYLKLYAAVDVRGRHLDDLKGMNPEPGEIEEAARWCLSQDVSEPFRELLELILEELGYGDVGRELP